MLDCLARLVNKKSRLERMKFAQMGDREVRKLSKASRAYSLLNRYCIRSPRGHRKLRLCYRNKQPGKETMDVKISQ